MSASPKMKDESGIEPKLIGSPNLKLVRDRAIDAGRDPLSERWMGKTIRKHIFEFGEVFALLGLIIAGLMTWKNRPYEYVAAAAIIGGLIFAFSYFTPAAVRPVWSLWMKLAMGLGHFVTLLILGIMWILVMLPIAFLLRVMRKNVMDTSFDRSRNSYWESRDSKNDDFELLLRQF